MCHTRSRAPTWYGDIQQEGSRRALAGVRVEVEQHRADDGEEDAPGVRVVHLGGVGGVRLQQRVGQVGRLGWLRRRGGLRWGG